MLAKPTVKTVLRRPKGYTLIELLVVIAIIGFLAGLLMLMWPAMQSATLTTSNADKIQSMLLIAKQRAIRDRALTGVRLILDPNDNTNTHVNQLIYIQQPDPFTPANAQQQITLFTAVTGTASFSNTIDFTGGIPGASIPNYLVQPGDYLEVNGGGMLAKISAVSKNSLVLASPISLNSPTSNFRIIRMPRVLSSSEEPLVLDGHIIIDLSKSNVPQRSDGQATYNEILFAPSGSVVGQGAANSSQIILFVRDPSNDTQNLTKYGANYYLYPNPILVGIQVGTGLIGGYPVNVSGADPYSETRDPHAGGM